METVLGRFATHLRGNGSQKVIRIQDAIGRDVSLAIKVAGMEIYSEHVTMHFLFPLTVSSGRSKMLVNFYCGATAPPFAIR